MRWPGRAMKPNQGGTSRPDLARLNAQRPDAESFAAEGAEREQETEREHLPGRRYANVQSGQGEIIAERPGQLIAAASPNPAGFEQRCKNAHYSVDQRQRFRIGPQTI